jgi:hypothetical protein
MQSLVYCLVAPHLRAQLPVPGPDSTLAYLVSSTVFDSLRGSGWRLLRPHARWIT